MRGYPKFLNSKADYEYVRLNFPKSEWEADFNALLDSQYEWFNKGKIEGKEAGTEDATHKVVESDNNGTVEYHQYELQYNPDCRLMQLGYTAKEVEGYLNQ